MRQLALAAAGLLALALAVHGPDVTAGGFRGDDWLNAEDGTIWFDLLGLNTAAHKLAEALVRVAIGMALFAVLRRLGAGLERAGAAAALVLVFAPAALVALLPRRAVVPAAAIAFLIATSLTMSAARRDQHDWQVQQRVIEENRAALSAAAPEPRIFLGADAVRFGGRRAAGAALRVSIHRDDIEVVADCAGATIGGC